MILDGKIVKEKQKEELKNKIKNKKLKIQLNVIQIGDYGPSNLYIKNKKTFAQDIGVNLKVTKLDNQITENEIIQIVENMNKDEKTNGIIMQLPVPEHINANNINNAILPHKDVDGLNLKNLGKLITNEKGYCSATAKGIISMLEYYQKDVKGQNVVIAGRSNLVSKPLAIMLINMGATVTICNSHTKDIKKHIKNANIFISAIGKKNFFTADYFEDNREIWIFDVGINFENGKIYGDVDFDNIKNSVAAITPVPGGVGQMTVLEIFKNMILLNEGEK